uniref:Peptidase M48 domain-containing protein n=1 Tax=Psilocybe cubensis TaxID=181762 RepID=A0A8H7Y290_PSICU
MHRFELARVASRIALTFIPFLWFNNVRSHKMIKYAALHGFPLSEEKQMKHMKKIRRRTMMLQFLLFVPFVLFWATITASLEKTPLTGRWRMILLSPEEEDEIAAKLAGPGWYNAVGDILAEQGSPKAIPPSDWRYQWVNDTLRRLESSIPILSREPELCPKWMEGGEDSKPLPPPAKFPLRPRPRASEYIHWACMKMCNKDDVAAFPPMGPIPGVPYSLLVVENPEQSNAFSYGFGPDGGSGIVVYTGFLDEIFARHPQECQSTPPPAPKSSWSSVFRSLFSSSPPPPPHPIPTSEQTAELAILLAHEMAHLLLSHHLESLSSVNIIIPGTLSIMSDILRVLIFPITMLFGPFVNDAVAQIGKVGSGELLKISEYCSSTHQEIEADVVSARLLAHAGFDARDAIKFWEHRSGEEAECAKPGKHELPDSTSTSSRVARQIMGDHSTHPVNELRVNSLKEELARWESERQKAVTRLSSSSPP